MKTKEEIKASLVKMLEFEKEGHRFDNMMSAGLPEGHEGKANWENAVKWSADRIETLEGVLEILND